MDHMSIQYFTGPRTAGGGGATLKLNQNNGNHLFSLLSGNRFVLKHVSNNFDQTVM